MCSPAPMQKITFFPDCTFEQGKIMKKINNVEALKKENDLLTKQLDELRKDVLNLKEGLKPRGPPKQHGAAESLSCKAPSAKDAHWLSNGYDELHRANVADKVSQITKAVDEIQLYSYQYNVKIVGVPQAEGNSESAEDTVKKCLDIFFKNWSQRVRI